MRQREEGPDLPIPGSVTWDCYFQALSERDVRWRHETHRRPSPFSVFPPGHSWVGVIANLRDLIRKDWSDFSESDQRRLLGLVPDEEEHWRLLGRMRDVARRMVFDEDTTRTTIEKAVKRVIGAAADDFPNVVMDASCEIQSVRWVGVGVATRLLTVARPDHVVSLNGGSAKGLARFSGLSPTTLTEEPKNYERLLRFIYEKPWFRASQTACRSRLERKAWCMRAALLDCFVYRG